MPNHDKFDESDSKSWQVESLRTTCFPNATAQFGVTDWWQEVVNEQPENRVLRLKEGFQQDEGHINGIKLVLGIQPVRIDWVAVPGETQHKFWMGPFQETLDWFIGLMSRWLRSSPPLKRLAFGAVLMLPVEDRRSGYELIEKYLPHIQFDSERSSDFLYQINRPRDSRTGIPNLKINRLSKWSVVLRGTGQIELSPHEARASFFPTSEAYACRLELDINTVGDYQGDLPQDQLPIIFQELVEFGKEITIEGDVP